MSVYRETNSLEQRRADCKKTLDANPDDVPLVLERTDLRDGRVLFTTMARTATVIDLETAISELARVKQKRCHILSIGASPPPSASESVTLGELYDNRRENDGFLHVTYVVDQDGKPMGIEVRGFVSHTPSAKTRYTYVEYLNQGASGAAWRIVSNADSREYALKVTSLASLTEEQRLRTETEVKCLESVDHFACIRLYDKCRTSTHLYLVLELCNAGDLSYQIRHRQEQNKARDPDGPPKGMEEHEIKFIFLQLTLGLHYMHVFRKILHRDLKPANVLLTTNGFVKIGDFGLSNVYDTISGNVGQTICGTPLYVAPELWERKRYGTAADMWSLGVLLYECTGQPPFSGKQMESLRRSILTEDPPLISDAYSPALRDTIHRLLQKDPDRRPDCATLLDESYLRDAREHFREVLRVGGVAPPLLNKVMSDVVHQLSDLPTYVMDLNVSFETDGQWFRESSFFMPCRLSLRRGELHVSALAGPQGPWPTTVIPLTHIWDVHSFSRTNLALVLQDGGFCYFCTPDAAEWRRQLYRAQGWNAPVPPSLSVVRERERGQGS